MESCGVYGKRDREKVATTLRLRGYDVISAHEVKKWGIRDREQLDFAIGQKRAIFTFNVRDYVKTLAKVSPKLNSNPYG